ncbi:uncharacterized protein LOC135477117 [Liolophura sinensis]|uniref:uncharacterized protein LOC135477117 n=1 Tax=Liolophura sinensis TaxID=3198878 RepID=UPI003158912B
MWGFSFRWQCLSQHIAALVLLVAWIQLPRGSAMSDVHGGVKMGVSNHACDDAKANLTIDGDPRVSGTEAEFLCLEEESIPVRQTQTQAFCQPVGDQVCVQNIPLHKCMDQVITYRDSPPLSGAHRPLWPVYGEYLYLPAQRWLHSMEHGAIVLLYHPCADPEELAWLKSLVRGCIRRHIITPYRGLPTQQPFALLAWRCKLSLSYADTAAVEKFIKEFGIMAAPESGVYSDGQFDVGLISKAEIVSDVQDSNLCPQ